MLSMEEFEDTFSKRLEGGGRRSTGKMPPSGRSKSISRASRRKTLDPSILPGSRGQPVPQVSEVGCGCKTWNRMGLGIDLGTSTSTSESARKSQTTTPGDRTPPGSATSQTCPKSANLLPKSVSGIFRRVKSAPPPAASSPKFEEQWSSFREQHQQEMNEMKQMYSALQSMCQEIKTITGLQPQAGSITPPTAKVLFNESELSAAESLESPPVIQKPTRPQKEVASEKKAPPERRQHVTPRRARSVPRVRSTSIPGAHHNPARDLSASVNLFFRSPWTDITASLFEEIVQVQKTFLRSFCQSLAKHREATVAADSISNPNFKDHDVVSSLVARLLPHTSFAKPWHLKYAVEAWVNRLVLGDFGSESYGLEEPVPSAWDEYQKLALLSPSDAINPACSKAGLYHENFHMFCNRKFQAIHDELQWWEEWPATLVDEFLEAMKHVWRAHKLAFSFDAPAAIFCVKTSTAFDPKYMETVLEVSQFDSSAFSSKVGFMVTPGFLVNGQVIKSQVYLMPKVGRLICSPSK
ncbi:hypothetical protein M758_3G247500 [Ceratodon purpureus]|uniref:GIL1/IRKI C-terminal domain-containing protein n=1 Tax=Ceratodon purpureus TaxID=3225 RepID=A0A8T0IMI2_CERPU|nr:hypothetical protein KC19_3G247200 [Ceratodon purpureus]KAG0624434.1 hypothetical protein M758_3G247500 [Ceratodon purpureus]